MNSEIQTPEERLARLERYVAKVDARMKEIEQEVKSGNINPLSEIEIQNQLSRLPELIASTGLELAHFRRAFNYAELDDDVICARLWNEANQKKEELGLSNAKDRDAYIKKQKEYIETKRHCIEWKYNLERMTIIYERYQNLFVAVRKLASLAQENYKAQDDYVKYNREVGM